MEFSWTPDKMGSEHPAGGEQCTDINSGHVDLELGDVSEIAKH